MAFIRHLGRNLMLAALVLGLNALCYVGYTHGRHAQHYSRVNYTHVPPHGTHRPTGRGARSQRLNTSDNQAADHIELHVASKSRPMHPVLPMHAMAQLAVLPVVQPETTSEPLALVNVVALGSAPRAPGGSRGPPLS